MLHQFHTPVLALDPTLTVILWVVGGILLSGVALWIVSYFVAAHIVYNRTLRRTSKAQWSRNPSALTPEHRIMDAEGMKWHEKNLDRKTDVHIVNRDGMNLYGEYYDFGGERCVMILSGRTESLRYGYYFAQPYAAAGCNVLVLDPRAHGLSDGEFNTVGFEESGDIVEWVHFLHDELHIKRIIFHGICIGAAGGMLALTARGCPDYVEAIVTDGMFPNFGESMKNHLIELKKPVRFMYELINARMKHYTGHDMNVGPIDHIHKLRIPILMLYSKEDKYSLPVYAERLFALAGSEQKELVWFEHGAHSMLRLTDSERYDAAITRFLNTYKPLDAAVK